MNTCSQNIRKRPLRTHLLLLLGVTIFFVGRWTAPEQMLGPKQERQVETKRTMPTFTKNKEHEIQRLVKRIKHEYLTRSDVITEPESVFAEEERKEYEREQSDELISLLMNRLRIASNATPQQSLETTVNSMNDYMAGWAAQFVRTGSELTGAMAEKVEEAMCDAETSDEQLLMFSRIGILVPDLISSTSFDCLFANRSEEDIVLWTALDAWRSSELPKSETIKSIENRFQDSRTQRRFLQPEQEMVLRTEEWTRGDKHIKHDSSDDLNADVTDALIKGREVNTMEKGI